MALSTERTYRQCYLSDNKQTQGSDLSFNPHQREPGMLEESTNSRTGTAKVQELGISCAKR